MGELVLDGDTLVHSEAPAPKDTWLTSYGLALASASAPTSPAARDDFLDVELDLEGFTPFQRASATRCGVCPSARRSPTASSPRSPAIRMPSARRARSAPTTASRSSCRATAWSQRTGSGRTARWASTTSAGSWSSKVSLSDDLRNELAAIAPERDCDRLAELSGLAHSAGSVHLLGRGEVAVHFDVSSNAVARRVFGLLRSFGVEAQIRTYRRRAFERSTRYQVHVPGDERAIGLLRDAGILGPGAQARRAAAAPRRRPSLLPRGLPARSPPGRRLAERAAQPAPRDQVGVARRRRVPRLTRAARRPRPWAARDRIREGNRDDRGRARGSRGERRRPRARRAQRHRGDAGPGEPPGERGPRQPRPREPRRARAGACGPQLAASGELERLDPGLREVAELRLKHPSLSLRELGLKCRPPAPKASVHRRLRKVVDLAAAVL